MVCAWGSVLVALLVHLVPVAEGVVQLGTHAPDFASRNLRRHTEHYLRNRILGQKQYGEVIPNQDCHLRTVSVKREGLDNATNPESLAKDQASLTLTQTALNHFGWYVGIENLKRCAIESPYFDESHEGLPNTAMDCLQTRSLQAKMVAPSQLPMKLIGSSFFSASDSRAEYAVLGTPGGDMGEFIRAVSVVEQFMGTKLQPDTVYRLVYGLMTYLHNESSGQRFFYLGSDMAHHKRWYNSVGLAVDQQLNPLDDGRRLALVASSANATFAGNYVLRSMLEAKSAKKWGVRPAIAAAAIRTFFSVHFNLFDSLRQNLMYVKLSGEDAASISGAAVVEGRGCRFQAPLVVPKIRAPVFEEPKPPAPADAPPPAFLEVGEDPPAEGKKDNGGSQFLIYHRDAVLILRKQIADFLGSEVHTGLSMPMDRNELLLRLTALGDRAYKYLITEQADKNLLPNTFTVAFGQT